MADNKGVQNVITFCSDEQRVHETSEYGSNQKSVSDALDEQKRRARMVKDYSREVRRATSEKDDDDEDAHAANTQYYNLSKVTTKRLGCLESISQIASLEELIGSLSVDVSGRASSLVNKEEDHEEEAGAQDGVGLARVSQGCLFAVRENWAWISKLVQCVDVHLKNASDFHQFFHEIEESQYLMNHELSKAQDKVNAESGDCDEEETKRLAKELKELLTLYLHWQNKVLGVFEKSKGIVPVNLRTEALDYERPVTALAAYKTRDISVKEGEEVTLMDNSEKLQWLVRNIHNTEAHVPSAIFLIPGPDPDAINAGVKLLFQLLTNWTLNLIRIGKTIIKFLLLVFKDYNDDEVKFLQAMTPEEKEELLRIVTYIEGIFDPYWGDYKAYQELKGRFARLREILAEEGHPDHRDEGATCALLDRMTVVEELLKAFAEFWKYWETFRIIVLTMRHPKYTLIVEKWEELKFAETADILKYWHTALEIEEDAEVELETIEETADSEQVTQSEQEEKKTFVITGVLDPRTEQHITMQDAVTRGIIDAANGLYLNPVTGEKYPIPVAMNAGFILVEYSTTKKSKEKKKDIGLITIKTVKEQRPYTVKSVIDAATDKAMPLEEAIASGLINENNATYKNNLHNTTLSFADAIDSGLIRVEFDKRAKVNQNEMVKKTYAVHAVVDQLHKKKVPFSDAVRLGLIDRETGAYFHNVSTERVYIGDAIKRGFVKATVVSDPATLDIDPENRMVVEKVDYIKKKLLIPMRALAALKKAAEIYKMEKEQTKSK